MIDLAQHAGLGPVQSHDIAERQDVPEPYLNQLLTLLRKAGLIASRRGPGGGHFLAKPATRITLAEVVTALEGPVWTPDDEDNGRWESLQGVWDEVAEAVLGSPTRSDVCSTWRWRFDRSTRSKSTIPSVPTPAAAR